MKQSLVETYSTFANDVPELSPVSTNTKNLKVLLYGNIQGAQYRSQTLIKFLLDSRYSISLVCPNFYFKRGTSQLSLFRRVLLGIHLIELFVKASFADVIYVLPLNNNLIKNAIFTSKLFRNKLVVENHVSLYDTLLEEKKYKQSEQKAKQEIRKDRLALMEPNYVISTCNHETAYWKKILNINLSSNTNEEKNFIAPLFSSSQLMLKRKFMQDGTLKICWWGSFLPLHGLDNILQAMQFLKERKVRFTCNLFAINNSSFKVYAEKIQLNELDSCVFLRKDLTFFDDSLPQFLIENCDLALGIFGNTPKAHNTIPTKLVEALSIGIPTLTMYSPALTEFFAPQTDLWTCAPSPVSIAETIMTIIDGMAPTVNWNQTRQKVLSTFSITQYQIVLNSILSKIADELGSEK